MTSPDWAEAVHPHALCLHLNFQGEGRLQFRNQQGHLLPARTLSWARGTRSATRSLSRDGHECLTLVYPDAWLAQNLKALVPKLPEALQGLVAKPSQPAFLQDRALTSEDLAWARALSVPPQCEAARHLLEQSQLTDFLVRQLFAEPASPAAAPASLLTRAERVARERVARVQELLRSQLDESHDLESLSAAVGCSPFYLSRTFSQVTGTPLMLWIRRTRIDRASKLIAAGRCNVSEAALEVGYRSFSHFSRAFQQEKGVSPSKWITHLAKARAERKTTQH